MRVDAVIPVWNGAAWVAEAVASVLDQTTPVDRILVVDDASTDRTPGILSGFGDRIEVLHHERNRGLPAARNTGTRASRAELVGFLDADDVWDPAMVARQTAEFARHRGLGLAYTRVTDCDERLVPLGAPRPFPARSAERVFDALYRDAFAIPPSTVFVRREALLRAGLFDETMRRKEDFECWLRMAMLFPVSCLPESLCRRRVHTRSLSQTTDAEENMRYDALCFTKCAEAAAREGVTLPMPAEARVLLGKKRRLREFLRYGHDETARAYRRALAAEGAFDARDHAAWGYYRTRNALWRRLRVLAGRG
jgi:glycosyltransferase involved in cell wall biosynthesis